MKTVFKPWGKEEWLELNDKYCYKRLYINAGHRTSFQYHQNKIETNYIISGEAEVWLENDEGVIEKKNMTAGCYFHVSPLKKHRVIALTDIILQEVSTPEVDDVIRIEDDTGRSDGKIAHEHLRPALCIIAAGKGTRLGGLTDNINKGLLPVDNKAAISYIIEKVGADFDIVVAVGYKADELKAYCLAAHPEYNFNFVEIDNVDGPGSGPGLSTWLCKEYLQRPFYLSTVDCLIKGRLPSLDTNWLGVYPTDLPELFSTAKVDESWDIVDFKNKDANGFDYAFIGLCGIVDYEDFWSVLGASLSSGELVTAFYDLKEYHSGFKAKQLMWYDIGTVDNYLKTKEGFGEGAQYNIPKTNGEFFYRVKDRFIKISNSVERSNRLGERAKILSGIVPDTRVYGSKIHSYDWITGRTLYDHDSKSIWANFLDWCSTHLWAPVEKSNFNKVCEDFYLVKTYKRLQMYLDKKGADRAGKEFIINQKLYRSLNAYLDKINWDWLCDGVPTFHWHGDLQFDNIISSNDNEQIFTLVDWRDSFALSNIGDVYYDLAKMYGGIRMSYSMIKNPNSYSCVVKENHAEYAYDKNSKLEDFEDTYIQWLERMKFDINKVRTLTALIYLNMAPLHEHPLDDLLFFHSIKTLGDLNEDR